MNNSTMIKYTSYLLIFLFSFFSTNIWSQTTEELLEKASDLFDENKYEEMLEVAEKVLELDPDNAKGHNYLGIYYDVKSDIIKAKKEYEIANRLDQNFSAPWANLAVIFINEEKYDLAIEYYRKYCAIKPEEAERWTSLASGFYFKGVHDSTLFYCEKAIAMDDKQEAAYFYQAFTFSNLDKKDKAYSAFDNLITIAPTASNYATRGDFKLDLGDTEGAFNDFNKAIKEAPENVSYLSRRSEIFFYQEEYEKSKTDALKVLALDEQNDRATYFLGWDELELGNREEAYKLAKIGLQNPDASYNYNYLAGNYYWRTQKYAECRDAYKLASEFIPFNSEMIVMNARATLFSNMDMSVLDFNDGDYVFKEINSNNTLTMDEWVEDSNHKYSYENLLKKYNTDYRSLSFDEYFMLYYGSSSRDDYAPYSTGTVQKALGLDSLFEAGQVEEVAKVCEEFLKENHFVLEPYFYAASAYEALGNKEKYDEFTFKGNMFMESILSTGDGQSMENAWVVVAVKDEYNIKSYFGISTTGQALFHDNGHSYDGLTVASEDGDEKGEDEPNYLYFNIDKPFNSLSNMFDDKKSKKKKKKKRRKKKRN